MIRRKNYFIKKKFQTVFVSRFLLLLLIEALLIGSLFMYISNDTLTTGYLKSVLTIERTPSFFLLPFILIIMITGIGIGLAGIVIFITLSHRIAGPLYRFEKDLEKVGEGDLTKRITLRSTDQLAELKETLNFLVGSLDERVGSVKNRISELEDLLSKKDSPDRAAGIKRAMQNLKDEIERFKVTSAPKG